MMIPKVLIWIFGTSFVVVWVLLLMILSEIGDAVKHVLRR